ncbi:MAG: exodeoxyribonuclease VII large subunit [Clostridiales bacterium]|nr:exodeoxyribonuclease VII large subunit [Clostridiales bacterium]
MAEKIVITVSELNRYVDGVLGSDPRLRSVKVSGEISGFKRHSSGHLYFTLKDQDASVSCVMFRKYASVLDFPPEDGMKIIARGYVTVYPKDGKYQLCVESMAKDGVGEEYLRIEQLKKKLLAEGVFDNKRPLPVLPKTIGVATSATGATIHDIVKVVKRRFPMMNILFAPCSVQGVNAPKEIVSSVGTLSRSGKCDVIIVGRGGGSNEDLSAFNDEAVAREIAASSVPVVSAVGHEIDYSIADLAADLRANTPSAAAELCCPEYSALLSNVIARRDTLNMIVSDALFEARSSIGRIRTSSAMANPAHVIGIYRERLERNRVIIDNAASSGLSSAGNVLNGLKSRLDAMDPDKVIKRGYSVITDEDGKLLGNVSMLQPDKKIGIKMAGGSASALVTNITESE